MPIPPIRIVIAGVDRFTSTVAKSMQGVKKMGKKVSETGKKMTMGVTLPIVAFGALTLNTAANFEASMNRVQNLTQATAVELGMLKEQARDLGATTQFSASQAADAMGYLGMAGFEMKEIMSAMPATLNLAAASQMELAQTADIVSNILTGYNMKATQTGEVTDVLTSTFQGANTNLEQLGEAMKYVGPVASSMRIPLRDTATAIGLLGNAGMQGSMAGVQLRGILASLAKPSSAAASALERLKIPKSNLVDADGNIKSLRNTIQEFTKAGATSADLITIFGRRMGPGMAALVSQGVTEFDKLRAKLDKTGTAQAAAEVSMQGLAGQMKSLKSAFEELQLAIADSGILMFVTKIVEKLASFTRRIAKVNPNILKMGTIFAALAAAIGPVVFVIGSVMTAIGTLAPIIASAGGVIAAVSNPIGWVVAAIAGMIAWIALLRKAGMKWKEIFRVMFTSVTPLVAIVEFVIENWKRLLPFFKLALFGLVKLFQWFAPVFVAALQPVLWVLDKVIGLLKWVMDKGLSALEFLASKFLGEDLQKKIGFVGVGGEAPGGALDTQSRIEEKNTKQESTLKVQFQNAPAGTRISRDGSGPFDFETESGALLPGRG